MRAHTHSYTHFIFKETSAKKNERERNKETSALARQTEHARTSHVSGASVYYTQILEMLQRE